MAYPGTLAGKAIIKVFTKAEFLSGVSTGARSTWASLRLLTELISLWQLRTHSNLILQSEHRRVGWKGWINWKTEIGIYTLLYIK